MTYVGAFAISDNGHDLLTVTAILSKPEGMLRLCRLSDGLRLSLRTARVTILKDGLVAFREHAMREIRKQKKKADEATFLAEYLALTEASGKSYRMSSIYTYLLQFEFKRYFHPGYSVMECWRHTCVACDYLGIDHPTIGFTRSRLEPLKRTLADTSCS